MVVLLSPDVALGRSAVFDSHRWPLAGPLGSLEDLRMAFKFLVMVTISTKRVVTRRSSLVQIS